MALTWKPTTGWHTITPSLACDILAACNWNNRQVSWSVVMNYSRDMKRGDWKAFDGRRRRPIGMEGHLDASA